jgi:hypothetical protein
MAADTDGPALHPHRTPALMHSYFVSSNSPLLDALHPHSPIPWHPYDLNLLPMAPAPARTQTESASSQKRGGMSPEATRLLTYTFTSYILAIPFESTSIPLLYP